ncbi:transposase [Bacteroides caecigallinarum]|uniref:IS66 family transposase n=1 Tax=Bacteroides caecigallinarum TaxID=1411144 RepID=UPI001F3AA3C8|nr:transposase [Bacteroides caecigallinarum]MCF2594575.1 transposase [Bacteroides caecigallinarum]
MELEELIENTLRRKHLEEMMDRPEKEHTPLEGMDNEQIKRFALFLFEENQNKSKQLDEMIARLDEIGKDLKEANKKIDSLTDSLLKANSKAEKVALEYKMQLKEYKKLEKKHNALVERLSLMNTQTYASSKSLKGIDRKKTVKGKHDDKDDFEGTPTAPTTEVPQSDSAASCDTQDTPVAPVSKERPYRKGMRYNKECVGTPIIHKSDYTMLPKGSVVISSSYRKIRNIVSYIEEHHFEVLKVKHADGRIESMFLPMKDDARADIYNEIVPGTSITANMLSYLMFNHFQMSTPAYREAKNRLSDMDWNTSPQNLLNWAEKGAMQLNKLIPALKKIALQDGANVNVDETWLRYHAYNKKRKTYMWCLVNRKARIVIFFYEDTTDDEGVQKHGGRNRNVLKEFLGDAKIKSLQSDGYNVYMYLDNELMDIEHLCCLAHARAKFKYAYDQGSLQVRIFLELIAFSPPANPDESRSELMGKALNYLKNFWNQIFSYRNEGEYSIDNMAAERAIRPITVQRKNSLFFGSVKGIQNSAIYNTFIETCKQAGVSFRDYFCRLLRELKKGRTDYENLLPMTICK